MRANHHAETIDRIRREALANPGAPPKNSGQAVRMIEFDRPRMDWESLKAAAQQDSQTLTKGAL